MAETIELAVCGAHLSGMALNQQLLDRAAVLLKATWTTPEYRLYALAGSPPRPGLVKVDTHGSAIPVEVWQMPAAALASFLQGIPAPLGLGKVSLQGGKQVIGFICEPIGVQDARDITAYGGWREYVASKQSIVADIPPEDCDSGLALQALPAATSFSAHNTALIIIDMQRDFIEPGGFGAALGNDPALLQQAVQPCQALLAAARQAGMLVVHTREGHRPDLSDLPVEKHLRAVPGKRIGDVGPMGRILIRGEPGHDFIAGLSPLPEEVVIDKPGKGAFYHTELSRVLAAAAVQTVIICGVTTEVCVQTTAREANDRGYRVIVAADCCASYLPEFHTAALAMFASQGGIVGFVSDSQAIIAALEKAQASSDVDN